MDLPGTAFSKLLRRSKEYLHIKGNLDQLNDHFNKTYYVPVALCIKTKSAAGNFYEALLNSLIELLYKGVNNYASSLHNVIYSYAEFISHIISLTHIINPPPATLYKIQIGLKKLTYLEGPISQLPYEDDTSVAQLFCILDSKSILEVLGALLLDLRVILCAKNINSCFFLIKGFNQLMFPLKWQYSKGVTLSNTLLYQPYPYFYGILKTTDTEKSEIANSLRSENYAYLMLDTESLELDIHHERFVPDIPNKDRLGLELEELCNAYGIKRTGKFEEPNQQHIQFSIATRMKFIEVINNYVKDISNIQKKAKTDDFFEFSNAYVNAFKKSHSEEEVKFVDELCKSQCFAVAFDEVCLEAQKDYARYEVIKKTKPTQSIEYMKVTISSSKPVVISRLNKLANIVKQVKNKVKEKTSLKVKIDWIEEIFKMQKLLAKEKVHGNRKRIFSDTLDGKKVSICNTFTEIRKEDRKKAFRHKEINKKGTLFYGPMGMLSFLNEIFTLPEKTKNTLDLFSEVKSYLESNIEDLMNAPSYSKCFQSLSPIKSSSLEPSITAKSSFGSSLLNALVDIKPGYTQESNPFIKFNVTNCCQFFVFCAHYYSKHQCSPLEIAKVRY